LRNPWIAVLGALLALLGPAAGARGATADADGVGLQLTPGVLLPRDATFRDDTGAAVRLGDLMDRPLLLSFVYLGCSRQCPLVLGGLAEALGRLPLRPGEDYAVATISIDEHDTPAAAAAAKRNYLAAVGRPFPASAWTFLTGDRESIRQATDAVGLRFQRHGGHFLDRKSVV
jgi:protein SCO1/2